MSQVIIGVDPHKLSVNRPGFPGGLVVYATSGVGVTVVACR
jgi:hypothetical protein